MGYLNTIRNLNLPSHRFCDGFERLFFRRIQSDDDHDFSFS